MSRIRKWLNDKAWPWLKWGWIFIVGAVALLLSGRKPKWVKQKEKDIKKRELEIEAATERAAESQGFYEGVKQKHDEKLQEIKDAKSERPKSPKKPKPIDNLDDALDYGDDLIERLRR